MPIRIQEVIERVALTRGTIYRLVGDGKFPRPIHVAERSPPWHSEFSFKNKY